MKRKGFDFSIRIVIIVVIAIVAALVVISFLSDGINIFEGFSNRTMPGGGFVNGS